MLRLIFAVAAVGLVIHADNVAPAEFQARRAELIRRFPDGVVLLHSRADFYGWETFTLREDPSFYYFFGGEEFLDSILALDGTSRETWLFVPSKLSGLADRWMPRPAPGAESAARFGIEHVAPWEEFVPWIERRLGATPSPVLYVDDTKDWWGKRKYGRDIPESNPLGLEPIVDAQLLWRLSLERRWPAAKVRSASTAIEEMRSVKSPAEIDRMRAAGKATVGAWLRGSIAIGSGESQRQVQAEVVRGCIDSGARGPSFWPQVEKSADGQLVTLDIGCELDHYQTDSCRMVPASGHFSPEEKEAWEFYVAAYRAGLAAIHDGARRVDVFDAMIREADHRKGQLKSDLARRLAAAILDNQTGTQLWLVHSQGLLEAEAEPEILRAGMIVAFEPSMMVGDQFFNIEDETLVTKEGYEVLAPLPYDASAIERSMRPVKRSMTDNPNL
jgi:Xaa-Pro aminopeptidase